MDFRINKEQEAIQKAARDFAKGEFDKEIVLQHERSSDLERRGRGGGDRS